MFQGDPLWIVVVSKLFGGRMDRMVLGEEVVMPGKQIKNWQRYHALRNKGMTKKKAAKIANSTRAAKRKRGRRGRRKR